MDSNEEYEEEEEIEELVDSDSPENNKNFEGEGDLKNYYNYNPEYFNMKESSLKPITFNSIKLIEKKYKSVCKILYGKHPGTGFFCKINLDGAIKKLLFTNYHVLNEKYIKIGSKIDIYNDNSMKNINITKDRFTCFSKSLDYICIEILPKDNFKNFFEVERQIYEQFLENNSITSIMDEYRYHDLVLIQYRNFGKKSDEEIYFCQGHLKEYDGKRIFYSNNIKYGAKGAPIISMNSSLDIIGMHNHCYNKKKKICCNGILFNNILLDIKNKLNK